MNVQAYFGIGCILVSALLTAIYMMGTVIHAFFPEKNFDYGMLAGVTDPGWRMCVPLLVFSVSTVALGMFAGPLVEFFRAVAAGVC